MVFTGDVWRYNRCNNSRLSVNKSWIELVNYNDRNTITSVDIINLPSGMYLRNQPE